jgi:hypothetical protein
MRRSGVQCTVHEIYITIRSGPDGFHHSEHKSPVHWPWWFCPPLCSVTHNVIEHPGIPRSLHKKHILKVSPKSKRWIGCWDLQRPPATATWPGFNSPAKNTSKNHHFLNRLARRNLNIAQVPRGAFENPSTMGGLLDLPASKSMICPI